MINKSYIHGKGPSVDIKGRVIKRSIIGNVDDYMKILTDKTKPISSIDK